MRSQLLVDWLPAGLFLDQYLIIQLYELNNSRENDYEEFNATIHILPRLELQDALSQLFVHQNVELVGDPETLLLTQLLTIADVQDLYEEFGKSRGVSPEDFELCLAQTGSTDFIDFLDFAAKSPLNFESPRNWRVVKKARTILIARGLKRRIKRPKDRSCKVYEEVSFARKSVVREFADFTRTQMLKSCDEFLHGSYLKLVFEFALSIGLSKVDAITALQDAAGRLSAISVPEVSQTREVDKKIADKQGIQQQATTTVASQVSSDVEKLSKKRKAGTARLEATLKGQRALLNASLAGVTLPADRSEKQSQPTRGSTKSWGTSIPVKQIQLNHPRKKVKGIETLPGEPTVVPAKRKDGPAFHNSVSPNHTGDRGENNQLVINNRSRDQFVTPPESSALTADSLRESSPAAPRFPTSKLDHPKEDRLSPQGKAQDSVYSTEGDSEDSSSFEEDDEEQSSTSARMSQTETGREPLTIHDKPRTTEGSRIRPEGPDTSPSSDGSDYESAVETSPGDNTVEFGRRKELSATSITGSPSRELSHLGRLSATPEILLDTSFANLVQASTPEGPKTPKSAQKKRKQTGLVSKHFATPDKTESLASKSPRLKAGLSSIPVPPLSCPTFGLIQEELAKEPFKLLLAVVFLNKTNGKYAIPAFRNTVARYATPADLADANESDVVAMIHHLGLQNQRAKKLIQIAKVWESDSPAKGRRYRTQDYPIKGAHKAIGKYETLSDDDPRVGALEIGHIPGLGAYAYDSWRIFCRDRLRDLADGWNGEGARAGFEPEWKRVLPQDKELRAFMRWNWLKEGWWWDPETGEKRVAEREVVQAVNRGGFTFEGWDEEHDAREDEED